MEKIFLSKLIINQQWKEKSKYLKHLKREIAKANQLRGYSRMNKDVLVKLIGSNSDVKIERK